MPQLRATVGVCVGAGLLAIALLAATASIGEHGEKVVALYGEVTPCRLPSLLPCDNQRCLSPALPEDHSPRNPPSSRQLFGGGVPSPKPLLPNQT